MDKKVVDLMDYLSMEQIEGLLEKEKMKMENRKTAEGYVNGIMESIDEGIRHDMEVIEMKTIRDELEVLGNKNFKKELAKNAAIGFAQGVAIGIGEVILASAIAIGIEVLKK